MFIKDLQEDDFEIALKVIYSYLVANFFLGNDLY